MGASGAASVCTQGEREVEDELGFYAEAVSGAPTHVPKRNSSVARNRNTAAQNCAVGFSDIELPIDRSDGVNLIRQAVDLPVWV
jgi:hypothetical protein